MDGEPEDEWMEDSGSVDQQTKPCQYGNDFLILLNYAEIHFQKLLLSPEKKVMFNMNNFP